MMITPSSLKTQPIRTTSFDPPPYLSPLPFLLLLLLLLLLPLPSPPVHDKVMRRAREKLGEIISAMEFLDSNSLDTVVKHGTTGVRSPLSSS